MIFVMVGATYQLYTSHADMEPNNVFGLKVTMFVVSCLCLFLQTLLWFPFTVDGIILDLLKGG